MSVSADSISLRFAFVSCVGTNYAARESLRAAGTPPRSHIRAVAGSRGTTWIGVSVPRRTSAATSSASHHGQRGLRADDDQVGAGFIGQRSNCAAHVHARHRQCEHARFSGAGGGVQYVRNAPDRIASVGFEDVEYERAVEIGRRCEARRRIDHVQRYHTRTVSSGDLDGRFENGVGRGFAYRDENLRDHFGCLCEVER